MNINMNNEQYNQIIAFSKSLKIEQNGTMEFSLDGNDIIFLRLIPSSGEEVKKANAKRIEYNNQEFIQNTLYGIAYAKDSIYGVFHTHPSFAGAAALSKPDIETLRYCEALADKWADNGGRQRVTIIEAIVTNSEVHFYQWDEQTESVKRLPLFVDGIEKIPSIEKSKWQNFKDGFADGKNKVRK